ncbi:MAG: KGGVGR-motif variant AAA ATPase [Steroidobacteraceae bacterium]|jgi:MinD-like ATPase involved in chromosome partitioning or flagellar assembly
MYVVTFYSYKGGVGRSMALVNVGYQLASAGRTVLLVDFDLEAPGLPTFNLQRPPRLPNGIVDYVHEYLATGEAPSVADYTYKSESFENGGAIWVMPAGKSDEHYSSKFQNINWQDLYEHHDGFLLFEDLKEQWRTSIQPDYVLVDSRTGHTDIAGICTRQLPDAVCILFFPNDQNLSGLKKIVDDIRYERRVVRKTAEHDVTLHFVVSNVPTLDDEDRIVATRLRSFGEQLKYKSLAAQIHHYDSLALINQLVFCKDRPNSYLANEYATLADTIRRSNFEDRDTALEALRHMVRGIRSPMQSPAEQVVLSDERLRNIATTFPRDGEISFWLALAWRFSGDPEAAFLLFDKAIENGYASREVYFERGLLRRSRREVGAAIEDFWSVLRASDLPVNAREVLLSVQALLNLNPEVVEQVASSWSVVNLPADDVIQLATRLNDSEPGLALNKLVLTRVVTQTPPGVDALYEARQSLGLTLIGLGSFEEAIACLNPKALPIAALEQSAAFNIAMAEWGATGKINKELFGHVVETDTKPKRPGMGPNYSQCLAIAYWAMGDKERAAMNLADARRIAKATASRDFSAWRYLKVDSLEFDRDLDEMERLLEGQSILPRFISRIATEKKHNAVN